MATVAVHDADAARFPNLALMKLAAHHRAKGDDVVWYAPLWHADYNVVYSSKVFTYTPKASNLRGCVVRGGSGHDLTVELPAEVEHTCPDYSLYDLDYSLGFLTRGCSRRCPWCVVPDKEGGIHPHADVEEFLRHRAVVLLDNNVLACSHGIEQLEKLAQLAVRVDFNQGLDVRLIDSGIARRLAAIRWVRFIRVACDTQEMKRPVTTAVTLIRQAGFTGKICVYVLVTDDIDDAWDRVEFLRGLNSNLHPFAMPFRDPRSYQPPSREQRRFARWVNHKAIFATVPWPEYSEEKTA